MDGHTGKRAHQGHREDQSDTKRQKTDSVFAKGTIKLIRVKDFMTYTDVVTIKPGPRLNLVLGPNGTGKSSLVCAICVGLGGKTSLLGRADKLEEYVRRGQNACWIEITLSAGPGSSRDYVIRRDIHINIRQDDTGARKKSAGSTWKINGVDKAEREVKELVKSLNVQFENLCQFLPQDKVVEFARLNATELLESTEKAIGDATLFDLHQQLKQMRSEEKQARLDHTQRSKQLEKLKEDHTRQEREYRRYMERERLKEELEVLHSKKAWLEVVELQAAYKRSQDKLRQAKGVLAEKQREIQSDEGPLRALQAASSRKHQASSAARSRLLQLDKSMTDLDRSVRKAEEDLIDKMNEKERNLKDIEKWEQRQADLRRSIEDMSSRQAGLPQGLGPQEQAQLRQMEEEVTDMNKKVSQAQTELAEKRESISTLTQDILQLQSALHRMQDLKQQRLNSIDSRLRAVHEFVQAQTQAGAWRGQVLGPVLLEISNVAPEHVAFLEMSVGRALDFFVCSNRQDQDALKQWVEASLGKVGLTIVLNEKSHEPLRHDDGEASRYREYGITHTLDEVFDAPMLVKHVLCDASGLNRQYVGTMQAVNHYDELFDLGLRTIFTPRDQRVRSTSHYNAAGGGISINPIRRPGKLGGQLDAAQEERRQQMQGELAHLKREREVLEQQLSGLTAHYEGLERERRRLDDARVGLINERTRRQHEYQSLSLKLGQARKQLEGQKSKRPQLDEGLMVRQMGQLREKLKNLLLDQAGLVESQLACLMEYTAADLEAKELDAKTRALQASSDARKEGLKAAERQVKQMEEIVAREKAEFSERKREAEAEYPLTEELKAAQQALPDDVAELDRLAGEVQDKLDGMVAGNSNVAAEYNRRAEEIRALEREQGSSDGRLAKMAQDMEQKKGQWLPELQQIVSIINATFSRNFAEIGCAGEVQLKEHEDFDKYAIEIRVKFREDEPLQLLTANRQSGGERSVSTILYLIALQGVTVTPFRVVDEINQGMDPINERKVFVQLVESSCREGTPQCFLLTPKLLPGLPYTQDITVLQIMNGPYIQEGFSKGFNNEEGLFGARWRAHQEAVGAH